MLFRVGLTVFRRFRRSVLCRMSFRLRSEGGQSTVEYAVIFAGFLSLVLAFGSLWHVLDGGVLVAHALASASHHVRGVFSGVLADAFLV